MSEQAALLATKLYVPRPHPGFVVRPRLLDRLDQGLTRDLILVCAPPGSGKTALLADWAGRGQRPVEHPPLRPTPPIPPIRPTPPIRSRPR